MPQHLVRTVASLAVLLPLSAADIVVSAAPANPTVGQTVTVQIQVSGLAAQLAAAQFQLNFDTTKLDFVSGTKEASAASLSIPSGANAPNTIGQVRGTLDYPAGGAASSGTLATLTFTAKAAGSTGLSAIDYGAAAPFGCVLYDNAPIPAAIDVGVPASPTTLTIGGGGNLPPTATAQSVSVTEDVAKAITLAGVDTDGSIASFAITANPTKGVLSGSGASRTYTPNANANGSDSFAFTVTDNLGAVSAAATVAITIAAVNDAPVLASPIGPKTATVGTPFSYVVPLATFTDADGDSLAWTASGLPAGLSFASATRTISGSPTAVAAPVVTIGVSDGHGGSASTTFTLSVGTLADSTPPATPAAPTVAGAAVSPVISGTTEAGATVQVFVDGVLHGQVVADAAGAWSYTIGGQAVGTHSVTVTATDGAGNASAASPAATVTVLSSGGGAVTPAAGGGGGGGGCGAGAGLLGILAAMGLFLGRRRRR